MAVERFNYTSSRLINDSETLSAATVSSARSENDNYIIIIMVHVAKEAISCC